MQTPAPVFKDQRGLILVSLEMLCLVAECAHLGFVFYDFNKPEALPEARTDNNRHGFSADLLFAGSAAQVLRGGFSFVLIDPPFITREVWRNRLVRVGDCQHSGHRPGVGKICYHSTHFGSKASKIFLASSPPYRILGVRRCSTAMHHHCRKCALDGRADEPTPSLLALSVRE